MALIECDECGNQVSDRAETCPHCGAPVSGNSNIVQGRRVRTIEKTSKRYKAWQAGSLVGVLAGLIGMATTSSGLGQSLSQWAALLGGIALVWSTVAAWWHHG